VPLGKVIAVLVEEEGDVPAFASYSGESNSAAPSEPAQAQQEAPTQAAPTPTSAGASQPVSQSGDRQFASPFAKKLATEGSLDIGTVQGTGPNGRVIAADVKDALSKPRAAPAQATPAAAAPSQAAPQAVSDLPPSMFTDIENS